MQITGTHHVALFTRNFAGLREFYTETLGLAVVGGFPGGTIIFLDAGSTTIELIDRSAPGGDPAQPNALGWAHFAFEVPDVDAAYAELSAKGVAFHVLPKHAPDTNPSVRLAFFKDPDGNQLELFQPLGGRYPQPE
ncbi:MAG: VOC family protein [Chloroflexales bacterium]|nr:VOC family protein [Chloroflexales bacterium]